LTYSLLNPPGLTAGDVLLQDGIGGPILDVVRFNPSEACSGGTGCLVFYSDNLPVFDALGDASGPPIARYPNDITIFEVGTETNNGAIYTPVAGQPGFVIGAGAPVVYDLISDGTASLCPNPPRSRRSPRAFSGWAYSVAAATECKEKRHVRNMCGALRAPFFCGIDAPIVNVCRVWDLRAKIR
jgi:hypothetical protein